MSSTAPGAPLISDVLRGASKSKVTLSVRDVDERNIPVLHIHSSNVAGPDRRASAVGQMETHARRTAGRGVRIADGARAACDLASLGPSP